MAVKLCTLFLIALAASAPVRRLSDADDSAYEMKLRTEMSPIQGIRENALRDTSMSQLDLRRRDNPAYAMSSKADWDTPLPPQASGGAVSEPTPQEDLRRRGSSAYNMNSMADWDTPFPPQASSGAVPEPTPQADLR